MFAVVEVGSKQYLINEGEAVEVDKLNLEVGSEVVFDKVLLFYDGKELKIGQPYLKDVEIRGEIKEQKRSKKIIVFRYKPKTRYRKKKSQRRYTTKVGDLKIITKSVSKDSKKVVESEKGGGKENEK